MMETGFDISLVFKSLAQSFPIWGFVGSLFVYLIRRLEKNSETLEKRLKNIETKIETFHEEFEFSEKRADATDVVVSAIIKDSFSSTMIAKGTGGWPRIFGPEFRPNKGET